MAELTDLSAKMIIKEFIETKETSPDVRDYMFKFLVGLGAVELVILAYNAGVSDQKEQY